MKWGQITAGKMVLRSLLLLIITFRMRLPATKLLLQIGLMQTVCVVPLDFRDALLPVQAQAIPMSATTPINKIY